MQTNWSRRKFLKVAAASTALAGTGRLARAAADASGAYGGFNLGLQSYTLREFPVDKALEEINKLGLHSVEFTDGHFSIKSSPADIEAMKRKTQALDIKIMGHGVNEFTKDHAANRRWFEFAKAAGIRNISANPTEDAFDSLDKLCEEYQIRIAIHNHGPGAALRQSGRRAQRHQRTSSAHRRLRRSRALHPHAPKTRSASSTCSKAGCMASISRTSPTRRPRQPASSWAKATSTWWACSSALRKVNFPADGCLSLEYEENPKDPLADVKACLNVASEAAKKAAG